MRFSSLNRAVGGEQTWPGDSHPPRVVQLGRDWLGPSLELIILPRRLSAPVTQVKVNVFFFFSFFLRYREQEEAYVATYGGRCW